MKNKIVFKCDVCRTPCVLVVDKDCAYPETCPYKGMHDNQSKWERVTSQIKELTK